MRKRQVIHGKYHILKVNTITSNAKGFAFAATSCHFTRCSFSNFVMKMAKKEMYMPCGHLYFVFIRVLGHDPKLHKYMHQGAPTKMSQALFGH